MYYVSNIDNEIHNTYDVSHNVVEYGNFTEIHILDGEGYTIDTCVGYDDINDLISIITDIETIKNSSGVNVDKSQWGVHAKHCCFEHGCKYGDDDCPVTNNLIKQETPCPDCVEQEDLPF